MGTCLEAVLAASEAYCLASSVFSEPSPTACFTLSMIPSACKRGKDTPHHNMAGTLDHLPSCRCHWSAEHSSFPPRPI
jgi:hypothetical protein